MAITQRLEPAASTGCRARSPRGEVDHDSKHGKGGRVEQSIPEATPQACSRLLSPFPQQAFEQSAFLGRKAPLLHQPYQQEFA